MRHRFNLLAAAAVFAVAISGCSTPDDTASEEQPATNGSPAPTTSGSVWVADEGADSLTVIDAATNAVAMTMTGLTAPHNVQVGRDGATIYAVSADNTVVAIDPETYTVRAAAATGSHPAHVIEAPNDKVYVTNSDDGSVSVFQTPDLDPVGQIELGGMPHGIRAAADGSVIVVANTGNGTLDLIDPATDQPLGEVPVGSEPAQVAVSTDGRFAYAGVTAPPTVVKVDLAEREVVGSTPVSAPPVQVYLTPDDTVVLSADQGTPEAPGNTLTLVDTAEMTVTGAVTTGSGPHGVVVDTAGTRAWVTNIYDDTVSVVDLPEQSVVATVPVGTAPNGISYSPEAPAAAPGSTTSLVVPTPETADQPQEPSDGHEHG